MRLLLTCAILAASTAAAVGADGAAADKQSAPTAEAIINSQGVHFAKLLAQFGVPSDIWPDRRDKPEKDYVVFDYSAFGFLVRNKKVDTCFFWPQWKGAVRGVKIGDSRDDVLRVLGDKPRATFKDKDGAITAYSYDLKDMGTRLYTNFDKDGKVKRVEISEP